MDFKLSEEQIMLRRTVREFAQNEVKPVCIELDAKPDPKDCFSWDLVKKASQLGLRTMTIPPEYGGEGLDQLSIMIVMEELGAGDTGFAYAIFLVNALADFMVKNCNQEQKDEFFPKLVEDDTFLLSIASTEPGAGTDNTRPYNAPGAAMQTFAERRGDEYVLNGTKHFITNGGNAKLYVISARMNREAPILDTMTQFLVPQGTPGFTIGKIHDKLGMRTQMNAELIMEDARIPLRYLIGEENKGAQKFRDLRQAVNYKNAMLTGCLRTTYEDALEYAKNRIQGGKPIIEHPTIAVKLAEMRVKIEAARLLVYKNAWSKDTGYEYDPKMFWLTKGFVTEIGPQIATDAVEILGGMGTDKDMPMEKNVRDIFEQFHGFGLRTMALWAGRPEI